MPAPRCPEPAAFGLPRAPLFQFPAVLLQPRRRALGLGVPRKVTLDRRPAPLEVGRGKLAEPGEALGIVRQWALEPLVAEQPCDHAQLFSGEVRRQREVRRGVQLEGRGPEWPPP